MPFSIKPGKSIRSELQRVVRHQLKLAHALLVEEGDGADLHSARKSVKKARAIVVLLREAKTTGLRRHDHRLRAVARTLSGLRDADAVIGTLRRVGQAAGPSIPEHIVSAFRRDLARARARTRTRMVDDGSVAQAADQLRAVRSAVADWDVPAIHSRDLPELVRVAYRAASKAMRRADRTSDAADLHEWRKAVKTLWYELRLLERGLAPSVRATVADLDRLETLLGEHHDLSVFTSTITKGGPSFAGAARKALTGAATARQDAVRQEAITLGHRVLADKPRVFARMLRKALSDAR